jgi:hypothetical protein
LNASTNHATVEATLVHRANIGTGGKLPNTTSTKSAATLLAHARRALTSEDKELCLSQLEGLPSLLPENLGKRCQVLLTKSSQVRQALQIVEETKALREGFTTDRLQQLAVLVVSCPPVPSGTPVVNAFAGASELVAQTVEAQHQRYQTVLQELTDHLGVTTIKDFLSTASWLEGNIGTPALLDGCSFGIKAKLRVSTAQTWKLAGNMRKPPPPLVESASRL